MALDAGDGRTALLAIHKSAGTAILAQTAHSWSQYLLYALIAAHVGAAFYHRFVLRDRLLERMLPSRERPRKS